MNMVIMLKNIYSQIFIIFLGMIVFHETGHIVYALLNNKKINKILLFVWEFYKLDKKWNVKLISKIGVLGKILIDLSEEKPYELIINQRKFMFFFLLSGPVSNLILILFGFLISIFLNKQLGLLISIVNIISFVFCIGKSSNAVGDLRAAYYIKKDDAFYYLILFGFLESGIKYKYMDDFLKIISVKMIYASKSSYKSQLYRNVMIFELESENKNLSYDVIEFLKKRYVEDYSVKSYINRCLLGEILVKYSQVESAYNIYKTTSPEFEGNIHLEKLKNKLDIINKEF